MSVALDGDFFRHEYGRLVAVLVRRVGMGHLELVEDGAQWALLAAVETWTTAGTPDNPSAWLFRVASNPVIGELRTRARRERLLEAQGRHDELVATPMWLAGEVGEPPAPRRLRCHDRGPKDPLKRDREKLMPGVR